MASRSQPDVIGRWDRSYADDRRELRLERSQYEGADVYALRLVELDENGSWRWSKAKVSKNGASYACLGIKARELEAIGRLLLNEVNNVSPALTTDGRAASAVPVEPLDLDSEQEIDSRIPF